MYFCSSSLIFCWCFSISKRHSSVAIASAKIANKHIKVYSKSALKILTLSISQHAVPYIINTICIEIFNYSKEHLLLGLLGSNLWWFSVPTSRGTYRMYLKAEINVFDLTIETTIVFWLLSNTLKSN